MKKIWSAIGLSLAMTVAMGQQSLPFVTNNAKAAAQAAEVAMNGLSEAQSDRLDQITASAAARAVLALKCESQQFESVSRQIAKTLDAKVVLVSDNATAARAYAKDAASIKYKAMVQANAGLECDQLDRLREIALIQGFDD